MYMKHVIMLMYSFSTKHVIMLMYSCLFKTNGNALVPFILKPLFCSKHTLSYD